MEAKGAPDHGLAGWAGKLAARLVHHVEEIFTGEAVECSGVAGRMPLPHSFTLGPAPISAIAPGGSHGRRPPPFGRERISGNVVTKRSWCLNHALFICW